jgi:cell shape-determining protein MreD
VRRVLAPVTIVTLFVVALQLSVFSSWRFAGVVVMLVWLWPLAVGMAGLTALSLWCALVAGIFFDTHTTTPFGLTALVALALAYGASRLGREGVGDLDSAAWWVTPLSPPGPAFSPRSSTSARRC